MPRTTDEPPRSERSEVQVEVVQDSAPAAAPGTGAAPEPEPEQEQEPAHPLTQDFFRVVMSSRQLAGRWEAADEIQAVAVMGEVTLDFTRAELPPSGVVDIDARSIMGSIHILVPDGSEVELEGTPVLGSIEQELRKKGVGEALREWVTGEREPDAPAPAPGDEPPCFRIDARAILGSVKVSGR